MSNAPGGNGGGWERPPWPPGDSRYQWAQFAASGSASQGQGRRPVSESSPQNQNTSNLGQQQRQTPSPGRSGTLSGGNTTRPPTTSSPLAGNPSALPGHSAIPAGDRGSHRASPFAEGPSPQAVASGSRPVPGSSPLARNPVTPGEIESSGTRSRCTTGSAAELQAPPVHRQLQDRREGAIYTHLVTSVVPFALLLLEARIHRQAVGSRVPTQPQALPAG